MKNTVLSLFALVILSACGSDKPDYVLNDTAFCSGFDLKETVICVNKYDVRIDGRVIEYFPNGKIHRDFGVKNGVLHGMAKTFYENGKQKQRMNYKNGKLEGVAKSWYVNGNIESEHNYKNGKYDGTRKEYFETGLLRDELNYKEGKLDGLRKEYHENGVISFESNYKNGVLDGLTKQYNKKGKLLKDIIKNAQDTSLQMEREYNEYGILIRKIEYNNYKEINRENVSQADIQKQCDNLITMCDNDSKKGCKAYIAGRLKVVSKSKKGIQLEGLPNIIIKSKINYNVGDEYLAGNTYFEYMGPHMYRAVNNIDKRIEVDEYKETDMPICK